MVSVSLFRHAKSAWDNPGLGDFDRPLAPRGEAAAPLMGAYIEREGLVPDFVLCSPAQRARQTLELASAEWSVKPDVRFEETLYLTSAEHMLSLLSAVPDTFGHVMIVGHNPGIHGLAAMLARSGDALSMAKMAEKFPTAALAVFDFKGGWDDISPGKGKLRVFVTPKSLR